MENTQHSDKHETKNCPRCGGSFVCKANRIEHCDCRNVALTIAASELIRERYGGCLCIACLREVRGEATGHAQ